MTGKLTRFTYKRRVFWHDGVNIFDGKFFHKIGEGVTRAECEAACDIHIANIKAEREAFAQGEAEDLAAWLA